MRRLHTTDQLDFVVTRDFNVFDTWSLLFIYVLAGHVAVVAGMVASGRRRGWWKRKSSVYASSTGTQLSPESIGIASGVHCMPWEYFYLFNSIYCAVLCIAMWAMATDNSACYVNENAEKMCKNTAGVSGLFFILEEVLLVIFIILYLSHYKNFAGAIVVRLIMILGNVVLVSVYIAMGCISASIAQSVILLMDITWLIVVISARRLSVSWQDDYRSLKMSTSTEDGYGDDDDTGDGVLPTRTRRKKRRHGSKKDTR